MKKRILLIVLFIGLCLHISCVQEEHLKTVTFKLDASKLEDPTNIGVRGQFTSPQWQVTVPLTDKDGDGIFETTLRQETAQTWVEFKFVHHDSILELPCKPNRQITFQYQPERIIYSAVFNKENGEQEVVK